MHQKQQITKKDTKQQQHWHHRVMTVLRERERANFIVHSRFFCVLCSSVAVAVAWYCYLLSMRYYYPSTMLPSLWCVYSSCSCCFSFFCFLVFSLFLVCYFVCITSACTGITIIHMHWHTYIYLCIHTYKQANLFRGLYLKQK